MQAGPGRAHRPSHHRAVRARLGGGQVDVQDKGNGKQDEGHVVEEDAGQPHGLGEAFGPPEHDARKEEPDCPQRDREEEELLAAVILADLLVVKGNPLRDLNLFQNPDNLLLIMKGGVIYKRAL